MKKSKKTGTVGILILLSILLGLSGMAVVSADGLPLIPNLFYGTVTIDGEPADAGTTITAYIEGDPPRGSIEVGTAGKYGYDLNYLSVDGDGYDNGKTIIFKINGDVADVANGNDVYNTGFGPRICDLSIGEAPVGTTPTPAQDSSSDDASSNGGAAGGVGGISLPGPLPTVTPNGATSAPEEGATPDSSEPTITSTEAHTSTSTDDESGSGGILPGFEAMFAITGLLTVAYLVRRRGI